MQQKHILPHLTIDKIIVLLITYVSIGISVFLAFRLIDLNDLYRIKCDDYNSLLQQLEDSQKQLTALKLRYYTDGNVSQGYETDIMDFAYVADLEGGKYHKSTCRHVKDIPLTNRVYFSNAADAISSGYTACAECNP